ncbi:MAG: MarR family winged helix-turn-helix transcriptional regulator [Clostridia bacterium]|nr:MarR family winged helix-turn-helix transcriptional regulator [Clostridia bacterium]
MEKVFENFVISVLKLYRLVQRIKNYEMKEFGLKSIHVMCIYYLNESRDGLTSGELMRLTFEDKAAISRAVGQLCEKKYVTYDAGKYNSHVRLTHDGKVLAKTILEKSDRAVNAGRAEMTEEERQLFYKSLGEIAENLKNYYGNLIKGDGDAE